MIRKGVIECAYKDLELNAQLVLEDVTITDDNEVKGTLIKDDSTQKVYIRFTKDFSIALVQYYDNACEVLEDIEIYRWSFNENSYYKADFA